MAVIATASRSRKAEGTVDMSGLAKTWNARVGSWHDHVFTDPAFGHIREAVLSAAAARSTDIAVDLGAGTGLLTLPLAGHVAHITAVDVAPAMLDSLIIAAHKQGTTNVDSVVADLAHYDLSPSSVDLVVSSYALHHLSDRDKSALLQRIHGWLRPGGRLIIADMMFGRGSDPRDRVIIRSKIRALARRGPAGYWRIAKNVVRFGLRVGSERPATPAFWRQQSLAAGFEAVAYQPIVAEAGLLIARAATARSAAPSLDPRSAGSGLLTAGSAVNRPATE